MPVCAPYKFKKKKPWAAVEINPRREPEGARAGVVVAGVYAGGGHSASRAPLAPVGVKW
jgi:hypothetical protein